MLLAASYYTRIIVRRRLKPGAGGFSAQHVDYYDVDSLDYGFNTASKGVAGAPSGSARLYPERWLMLFLYSLNMATLSVLASSLPSSQLPAQHLYGVEAYPSAAPTIDANAPAFAEPRLRALDQRPVR